MVQCNIYISSSVRYDKSGCISFLFIKFFFFLVALIFCCCCLRDKTAVHTAGVLVKCVDEICRILFLKWNLYYALIAYLYARLYLHEYFYVLSKIRGVRWLWFWWWFISSAYSGFYSYTISIFRLEKAFEAVLRNRCTFMQRFYSIPLVEGFRSSP